METFLTILYLLVGAVSFSLGIILAMSGNWLCIVLFAQAPIFYWLSYRFYGKARK